MGRQHRSDFADAFHHVFNRASARRMIFTAEWQRKSFLETLEHVVKSDNIEVHAYCLMGNHYHLLLRTPHANLSQAMHRLASMFSRRFNREEKIDGPIFRGRYRSKIVGQDDYLRQLCRYIHRNPVAAGIVCRPEDYEWSSYQSYIYQTEHTKWLVREELPLYFSGPNHLASMRKYVENPSLSELDQISLEKLLRPSSDDAISASRCIVPRAETLMIPLKPAKLVDILEIMSIQFTVKVQSLLESRPGISNRPRDISLFLARSEACLNVCDIAKEFSISRTAASTVISRVEKQIKSDALLAADIKTLRTIIQSKRSPLKIG